jgi:hypothetical protein
MEAFAMKLALVLLSLAVLNSFSLHAQVTGNTRCGAAISKVSSPSTPELWRGLAKNSRDLYAVTDTLRENRKLMEEAAQAGKPFDLVRDEAAKKGFPFGYQNIPYYERVYWKMYVAKNCADATLEAGASSPHDPLAAQGRIGVPNDDFFERQVDDATRGLGPAPDTTAPSETER